MFHRLIALGLLFLPLAAGVAATGEHRTNLVHAILSEDTGQQTELIKKLVDAHDPLVEQALAAWRQGGVFILETNETRIPFLLDAQTDAEGRTKAIGIADGDFLKDDSGKPLLFLSSDLT